MDFFLRDLLVSRIVSGSVRVNLTDSSGKERKYLIKKPTRDQLYFASEMYADIFYESELQNLYSDADLMDFMMENGFWDEAKEKALKLIPKQIEESKVSLYKAIFKTNERNIIRKALALAKAEYAKLFEERSAYGYLSCSGAAAIAKNRYIIGIGARNPDGSTVFTEENFWESNTTLLDDLISAYSKVKITDEQFRELARTEPWRGFWSCHKACGDIFGCPVVDWTEEQKTLISWSLLYDSIYSHPNCPSDSTIEDDDVLDGWLICQKREREKSLGSKDGDDVIGNERIRNSQEIMIPAETLEDAKKVIDLNDEYGKAIQKQRFKKLEKAGTIDELEMPDTKQRLRMEITNRLSQSMKGR